MSTEPTPSTSEPGAPSGERARPAFRAGDAVYISSVDEAWVLATDERDGRVICAGWPESTIAASECNLSRPATDDGRIEMLTMVAQDGGLRGSWARQDLKAMGIEPLAQRQGSLFE